jgi:hypothetical protein
MGILISVFITQILNAVLKDSNEVRERTLYKMLKKETHHIQEQKLAGLLYFLPVCKVYVVLL